jgi:flagellar hook-basal body protein
MSFYTSLTGLNAATTELAVTSNNIANSATAGFKRSSASFGDIFATSPLQRASAVVGQGVALKEVAQEFSQGFVQFSSNSLDMAITGDGFFPLQAADGTRSYTRNGQFMLNEQNQMVNSAGQALLSLPVDSTNKADFSQPPAALAIPRETVSEFRATTEVELGLNLPSGVDPITAQFNPGKPETFHRTTSLTVYGASGSQHLATIYYVKTQNATSEDPFNKWQTHVYIDGEQVDPALIQASDSAGDQYFVNKYGEIKTKSELEYLQKTAADSSQYLITQGTIYRKFSYDTLSDPIKSTPATIPLAAATQVTRDDLSLAGGSNGVDLSSYTRAELRNLLEISIDGSAFVGVGLEHLVGRDGTDTLSGQEIATELTKVINERFGDGRSFDLKSYINAPTLTDGPTSTGMTLNITRDFSGDEEDHLRVDVGAVLVAAAAVGDIELSGADGNQTSPEELAFVLNKYFEGGYSADGSQPTGINGRTFNDLKVEYDFANRGLKVTQSGDDSIHLTYDSAEGVDTVFNATNVQVFDGTGVIEGSLSEYPSLQAADGDEAVVLVRGMVPDGDLLRENRDQRYGIEVTFSDDSFRFSSGTTGDGSSIALRNALPVDGTDPIEFAANQQGAMLFGLDFDPEKTRLENTVRVAEETSAVANRPAVRGQASTPAVVLGNQMGVDATKPFAVTPDNRSLTVIVDNIASQLQLDLGDYSIGTFTKMVEAKVNLMADKLGRQVSGVSVEFDTESNALRFTGATATDSSFLQVAGSADFGLEDVQAAFGTTSTFIELTADTQGASTPLFVQQDRNGEWIETTDKGNFDDNDIPNWSPIFLDKGELTFDTSGTLISPVNESTLKSATTIGNDIMLDYQGSTQFNSPFAVLSQNQNGAPEGDLVGVNIGEDGLVVASYSNGSQKSLGKIILANFATPKGLRQIGNSGFTSTSESGEASLGEPGSAGYGTIRAGATERSNVDLTAELVNLITAQRNFQANAKAIETSSTLTQTIIQMRG